MTGHPEIEPRKNSGTEIELAGQYHDSDEAFLASIEQRIEDPEVIRWGGERDVTSVPIPDRVALFLGYRPGELTDAELMGYMP